MLDELHLANVEITSPSVVAQRQQPGDTRTLAKQAAQRNLDGPVITPEEKIFDSANAAANQEQLRQEIRAAKEAISESREQVKKLQGDERESALVALRGVEQKLRWLEAARDAGSTD